MQEVTRVVADVIEVAYNVTKGQEECNCTNSRIKAMPIIYKAPITTSSCGCDPANAACECCLPNESTESLYFSGLTCSNTSTVADCECSSSSSKTASCSCKVPNQTLTYPSLIFDTTNAKQCLCLDSSKTCKCCLGTFQSLIPVSPTCPASSNSTQQQCDCKDEFSQATNKNNLRCDCSRVVELVNNVTENTNQTADVIKQENVLLTSQACNCLNYLNGSASNKACNCCVPNDY